MPNTEISDPIDDAFAIAFKASMKPATNEMLSAVIFDAAVRLKQVHAVDGLDTCQCQYCTFRRARTSRWGAA